MWRLLLLSLLLLSCTQEKIENFHDKPTIVGIAEREAERTSKFKELVGYGVIEFKWEDENGKHREQGDFDFWKSDQHVSLRVSKVGELIVWAGCANGESWMFDFTQERSVLRMNDQEFFLADALLALQLIGFEPIPVNGDDWAKGWSVTFAEGLPSSLSRQDQDGTWSAMLRDPIGVELAETHALHWPKTPSNIDVKSTVNDVEIKLAFAGISTVVEDEPMDRVFNHTYLTTKLNPDSILVFDESK